MIMDRRLFLNVDYSLLLTFVFFFVFVGNMGKMKVVSDALQVLVGGRTLLISVLGVTVYQQCSCGNFVVRIYHGL